MSLLKFVQTMRLILMPLRQEQDVVLCRNRARSISAALQFDHLDQVRIATAVSEIARNAFHHAEAGTIEFAITTPPATANERTSQTLLIVVRDKGKGIADLPSVLAGTYRSETGLGMGIIGAKRLMDEVEFETGKDGTTVTLTKKLPLGATLRPPDLQKIIDEASQALPVTPLEELAAQNQELLRALNELRDQQQQLDTINSELSETNRGVVALYDELDTVYRVGRVVANKLDLDSLIQAITDATTDLSGAEFGAFFHHEQASGILVCHAVAGPFRAVLQASTEVKVEQLFGSSALDEGAVRINDVTEESGFLPLGSNTPIRSFLAVPVQDSAGELAGALVFGHRSPGVFTERTERILISVAVQASIGLENARLYRNAQAASAAKDQFLAILSHELRTPLNPVFAILAGLQDHPHLPEDVRADLQMMRRNLQLEARLIDDLLDLTRIVKGKIPLQQEVTDIHALIESARQTCQTAIDKQQVKVVYQLDAPRHHVVGDAARLQQVLWNLLSNAVKFSPVGGEVVIRTSVTQNRNLCVEVTDAGRGIEADAVLKIFRPFEQGDAAVTAQFGGLGLGLAISKNIVDAHGGEIWAESKGVGRGATFVIKLPLADVLTAKASQAGALTPAVAPRGVRILLVDDHEDTRHAVQRLLGRRGHQVTTASTSSEALHLIGTEEFDLLVSDLGLPDCSGHELVRKVHSIRSIPAIALSGYGMESDVERSHEAGFLAHLTKPVDINVLQATIEKITRPE